MQDGTQHAYYAMSVEEVRPSVEAIPEQRIPYDIRAAANRAFQRWDEARVHEAVVTALYVPASTTVVSISSDDFQALADAFDAENA